MMSEQTAEKYLRDRLALLEQRYSSQFAKWTVQDYVALKVLLESKRLKQPVEETRSDPRVLVLS